MKDVSHLWNRSFKVVMGVTGLCEMPFGLPIIFFAHRLQPYINTGILPELL